MSAKPDPAELLQVLIDIARSGARQHISQEFQRCVASSAGLLAEDNSEPSHLPAAPQPATGNGATTPLDGPATTGKPIEDEWWTAQDRDQNWVRQWEEAELDDVDPQYWK